MANEIKPPGTFGPFMVPGDDKPAESKLETSFAETAGKAQLGSTEPAQPGLKSVAQFSKGELQDPERLDHMVRASVSELIDAAQNVTGPLSGPEKSSLLEFLSGDPTFRRQVENYLRKVLA